jgi:hypothetical protein
LNPSIVGAVELAQIDLFVNYRNHCSANLFNLQNWFAGCPQTLRVSNRWQCLVPLKDLVADESTWAWLALQMVVRIFGGTPSILEFYYFIKLD